MDVSELKQQWLMEERAAFAGWDFSRIHARTSEDALPWDYRELIHAHLRPAHRLLDLGTGGGEFLLSLLHPYENTCVTEGWEPNVRLCRERLAPLGIGVYEADGGDRLPFADNAFDIVINRHESYDFGEAARVLKPGGLFITQQVGGENNAALSRRLIPGFQPPFPNHTLAAESEKCAAAGFELLYQNEAFPRVRFYDIGALVYFAKIIEWEFPGFSVEGCYEALCTLQRELEVRGAVESVTHRFVLSARKKTVECP